MTLTEAARHLGVSPKTLRRLLPRIPHYRIGGPRGEIKFKQSDLDSYVASCRIEPQPQRAGVAAKRNRPRVPDYCGGER